MALAAGRDVAMAVWHTARLHELALLGVFYLSVVEDAFRQTCKVVAFAHSGTVPERGLLESQLDGVSRCFQVCKVV